MSNEVFGRGTRVRVTDLAQARSEFYTGPECGSWICDFSSDGLAAALDWPARRGPGRGEVGWVRLALLDALPEEDLTTWSTTRLLENFVHDASRPGGAEAYRAQVRTAEAENRPCRNQIAARFVAVSAEINRRIPPGTQ